MQNQIFIEDISVGTVIPEMITGPITNEKLVKWAAGSGDFNCIHFDLEMAKKQGLSNVLVHGPYKSALAAKMFLNWVGKKGRIKRIKSAYTGMDVAGNTLSCSAVVKKIYAENNENYAECEFIVTNQAGAATVKGYTVLVLPSRSN